GKSSCRENVAAELPGTPGGRVRYARPRPMRAFGVVLAALTFAGAAAAGSTPPSFVIDGRGWGHGVGMSQWGAEGFAAHGWGYRQILGHYYPRTTLTRTSGVRIRVLLGDGAGRIVVASRAPFRVI